MNKQQNNSKADFWNEYFELYDVLNQVYPYQKLLKTIIAEMDLNETKKVLDAGAGTGNLALLINNAGAEVTGLDYSEVGLNFFKKKLPKSHALLHDLRKPLPFANDTFDYICCINILFAINQDHRIDICKEFNRVLKPGGKLIITNLSVGYKPIRIYVHHMSEEIRKFGLGQAFINLGRLIIPTIKMFYYSKVMQKENTKTDEMSFLKPGEQEQLLRSSKFTHISKEKKIFANQAVLNTAIKVK